MKCPRCGARTGISDSRLRKTNEVHRRRACTYKRCGYRFTTREVAAETLDDLREQASAYRRAVDALRGI